MLNGAGVAFPAVFAGAVVGTAVWFLTGSAVATGVLALAGMWLVGRYCYRLLK